MQAIRLSTPHDLSVSLLSWQMQPNSYLRTSHGLLMMVNPASAARWPNPASAARYVKERPCFSSTGPNKNNHPGVSVTHGCDEGDKLFRHDLDNMFSEVGDIK